MSAPLKRKAAEIATTTTKKPKANATITAFFSSPSSTTPTAAKSTEASSPTAPKDLETSPKSSQFQATDNSAPKATAPIFGATAAAAAGKDAPSSAAPTSKFDKAKWVEKLTPEQKDLLALEIDTLHESWLAQLKDEILSRDFLELKRFLKQEHVNGKRIFPPAPDVYSWYVQGQALVIAQTNSFFYNLRETPEVSADKGANPITGLDILHSIPSKSSSWVKTHTTT